MIYITGDTHGDKTRFDRTSEYFDGDTVIVCGDFGYLFENSADEHLFLDLLEKKQFNLCFCDGNHENFSALYAYPCVLWNGGAVHKIRKNIFHLMRGQIFTIEEKKIFTMGGAYSIDKFSRRENSSWWKEELPSNSEYREAYSSLNEYGNKVDFIITHTAPGEIIRRMGKFPDRHDLELTRFLDFVMQETEYKKWFFGHWHTDKEIDEKHRAVYFDIIKI